MRQTGMPVQYLGCLPRFARPVDKKILCPRVAEAPNLVFISRRHAQREPVLASIVSCFAEIETEKILAFQIVFDSLKDEVKSRFVLGHKRGFRIAGEKIFAASFLCEVAEAFRWRADGQVVHRVAQTRAGESRRTKCASGMRSSMIALGLIVLALSSPSLIRMTMRRSERTRVRPSNASTDAAAALNIAVCRFGSAGKLKASRIVFDISTKWSDQRRRFRKSNHRHARPFAEAAKQRKGGISLLGNDVAQAARLIEGEDEGNSIRSRIEIQPCGYSVFVFQSQILLG